MNCSGVDAGWVAGESAWARSTIAITAPIPKKINEAVRIDFIMMDDSVTARSIGVDSEVGSNFLTCVTDRYSSGKIDVT